MFNMCMKYLGGHLLWGRLRSFRSGRGLRFCIFNKLPDETKVPDPRPHLEYRGPEDLGDGGKSEPETTKTQRD